MTDEEKRIFEKWFEEKKENCEVYGNGDDFWVDDEIKKFCLMGYELGLKAGRPQWHDLRIDPNDLPKESIIEGLSERVIGTVEIAKNQYMSQECRYDFVEKIWKTHKDLYVTDVIAWCEIPTFDKE